VQLPKTLPKPYLRWCARRRWARLKPWPTRPTSAILCTSGSTAWMPNSTASWRRRRPPRILAAQETTNRRLLSLETRVTGVEASVVHVQERLDGIQAELDEMGRCLGRIERRLDPTDTPRRRAS